MLQNNFTDLTHLFSPRNVAIVGASANSKKTGWRVTNNLLKSGYHDNIFPINPKAKEILGLKVYESLEEVNQTIDVVVISLPAKSVLTVLEQCEKIGTKFVMIATSGFAELGDEGKEIQNEIKKFAQKSGIRVYGPNVPGLFNLKDKVGVSLSPRFEPNAFVPGNVGLATQGGGMGRALLDSNDKGVGFKYWASTGNEADLEIADFIKFFADDDDIDVITILIEGIKNGKKFIESANYAREKGKTIIALKIGETSSGQKAVMSHTGALAGEQAIINTVFHQCGVIKTDDIDELIDLSWLIATYGIRKSKRVGIMSFSGGGNGILADKCSLNGLEVAQLEEETLSKIRSRMPEVVEIRNPIDLTTYVFEEPEIFTEFISLLANDKNIDTLLIPIPYMLGENTKQMTIQLLEEIDKYNLPIIPLWTSRAGSPEESYEWMKQKKMPFFTTFSSAAKVVGIYASHYERLKKLDKATFLNETTKIKKIALEQISSLSLTEYESKKILSENGIPVTQDKKSLNVDHAIENATSIGYPVAMKVESKDILHKSDVGAVMLDLKNENVVEMAFKQIHSNVEKNSPNAEISSILVQEMAKPGLEMILGFKKDAIFGSVIILGLGGVYVEILKDVTMRTLPLTNLDVEEMINELKGSELLYGLRGEAEKDIDALKEIIINFSSFVYKNEEYLSEIDINPLIVYEKKEGVKALDGLIILNEGSINYGTIL